MEIYFRETPYSCTQQNGYLRIILIQKLGPQHIVELKNPIFHHKIPCYLKFSCINRPILD
jgi:hypothetical protein